MEWGQQMRRHEQVAIDARYHNTNYTNSREKKIPLIIDIEESSGNQKGLSNSGSFSVDLMEPLIIDELSDVYLDSCLTTNSKFGNVKDNMAFVVKIDQFNINTRSASTSSNQQLNNALLITNEHTDFNNHNEIIIHKGKKMNYVCSINPTKLSQFSGSITNLAGDPMFPILQHYVEINALSKAVPTGTPFTITGGLSGTTAVDHLKGVTDFYYYVSVNGNVNYSGAHAVNFTPAAYTDTRIVADTHVAGIHPRIIMEFLIVNRDK